MPAWLLTGVLSSFSMTLYGRKKEVCKQMLCSSDKAQYWNCFGLLAGFRHLTANKQRTPNGIKDNSSTGNKELPWLTTSLSLGGETTSNSPSHASRPHHRHVISDMWSDEDIQSFSNTRSLRHLPHSQSIFTEQTGTIVLRNVAMQNFNTLEPHMGNPRRS